MASHFRYLPPDPRDWPREVREHFNPRGRGLPAPIEHPYEGVYAWLPVRLSEPPDYVPTGRVAWLRWVLRVQLPERVAYVAILETEALLRRLRRARGGGEDEEFAPLTDRRTLGRKR